MSISTQKTVQEKRPSAIGHWLEKAYFDCIPYLPPVRLDICITSSCNAKCPYCWWQERSGSKLSFKVLAGLIDEMCLLKPPKLNLTGGEPTIWPGFEKLLDHAKNAGIKKILLCTNGLRLADLSYAEKLVHLGVTAINVSIDTLDSKKFRMLRGYDFSEMEKTLSNCSSLKKKYPYLTVSLASVMSRAVTPDELFAVKQFCLKHGFTYFLQTFDETRYPEINRLFSLSHKERQLYNKKLAWLEGRVARVVRRKENPLTERSGGRCYKGITTVKLFPDGNLSFCWGTPPVGNILKTSFRDIWTSRKAQRLRRFIRDKRCKCDFDCDVFESLELYEE